MISIFLQANRLFFNHCARNPKQIIIFIFLVVCLCSKQLIHQTDNTGCTIKFQTKAQTAQQPSDQLTFMSCVRKSCRSYKPNSECKFWQTFVLEEQKCMRECCGARVFSVQQCNQYNQEREYEQESANQILIIILGCSIGGLVITSLIFMFCIMKCRKNYEKQIQKEIRQKNGDLPRQKFELFWRPYKFSNKQCQICKKDNAFVMLQCQQFFHLQCLKQLDSWQCPHCTAQISKARVFCLTCSKYYITLKSKCSQQLQRKLTSAYEFHPQRCHQQIISEIQTDRKFTVSTKE